MPGIAFLNPGFSVVVALSNQNIDDINAGGAAATYTLSNTGAVQASTVSGGPQILGAWVIPVSFAGSAYECRATVNSGSVSSGTTGTWEDLGTSRSWSRAQASVGSSSVNLTVEIRNASTLAVLTSATIVLSATRTV